MPIKRCFLMLLIVISLTVIVANQASPQILSSYSSQVTPQQIQLQKQAKNIPNPKKQSTPFYQYKTLHSKSYLNSQQQVYRSIVYSKNIDKINQNNLKEDRKYNMVSNRFADLSPMQFSQTFTNLFRSSEKIKSYTKKIIDQQKLYDPTFTYSINQTEFIRNNQDDFRAVRDHVYRHVSDRRVNVARENSQFTVVEDVFATSNPNTQVRQAKNLYLKNYFDSNTVLTPISTNTSPGLNLQYLNTGANNDALYASFQRQLDSIIQTSTNTIPLKLTGDSGFLISGSTTISTSSRGNFSSSVIDWTVHAGKIRYQGICGACYTFATSDVVGALYSIYKFGFFVPLSTQQVVDCSTNGLTYGCNGGFLEGSYAYMQIKGIQTDANYPYTSTVSGMAGTCKKDGGTFKVTSFKNIEQGNCKALVNQLNYGPVSIGIAGYRLQFYSSGIFSDCNNYVDHAVVLIAYKGGVGWKIKNSWGPDWGMNGFAWIADGNNCGICNMGVSARI